MLLWEEMDMVERIHNRYVLIRKSLVVHKTQKLSCSDSSMDKFRVSQPPRLLMAFQELTITSHHPTALSDFNAQFLMTKVLSSRELNFISFSAFSKHSSSLMLFTVAFSSGYQTDKKKAAREIPSILLLHATGNETWVLFQGKGLVFSMFVQHTAQGDMI